jgi:hypothetical protein
MVPIYYTHTKYMVPIYYTHTKYMVPIYYTLSTCIWFYYYIKDKKSDFKTICLKKNQKIPGIIQRKNYKTW